MSLEGFRRLINSRALDAQAWILTTNYRRARPGDFLYIYTGDEGVGIVGFGIINEVSDPIEPRRAEVDVRIDFAVSRQLLLHRPLPASLVRSWLHDQKRAVENITHRAHELDRRLRTIKGYEKYVRLAPKST